MQSQPRFILRVWLIRQILLQDVINTSVIQNHKLTHLPVQRRPVLLLHPAELQEPTTVNQEINLLVSAQH